MGAGSAIPGSLGRANTGSLQVFLMHKPKSTGTRRVWQQLLGETPRDAIGLRSSTDRIVRSPGRIPFAFTVPMQPRSATRNLF